MHLDGDIDSRSNHFHRISTRISGGWKNANETLAQSGVITQLEGLTYTEESSAHVHDISCER